MTFAEQIKAQVDVLRTVQEYVQLKRMGTRWVGLCPFHNEKTPSFGITPALGIYKCFGCGAGGDVIKFIQEIEQLTFWEALTTLAERNGIPVPQRRDADDADTDLRAALFAMYETAAKVFSENLFGGAGVSAREYLSKRGVTAGAAQTFQLGYSEPGWDALVKRFGRTWSPEQMEASGLFGRREDGSFFDKFRGRLMFPIHNETGRLIAFGGRALRPEDEPKYLNSPGTKIYEKSHVLYNLNRAREAVRKSEGTVLVEGYMDVIGVAVAGVKNVVAPCGTALTVQQIRAMKRHSQNIVVNFDPDNAGASATERSIQLLLDEGMHVRVLSLEGGLDPDEFIRERGAQTYTQHLGRAANYFIWLAERARAKFGTGSAEARMNAYEQMLMPAIRRISDRLERAAVASEVADFLGLDRSLVLAEFRKLGGRNDRTRQRPASPSVPDVPVQHRVLLHSLLANPEIRDIVIPYLEASKVAKTYEVWRILAEICAFHREGVSWTFHDLEQRLPDEQRTLLSRAVLADTSHGVFSVEQAQEFCAFLDREEEHAKLGELDKEIKAAEKAGQLEEALRLMAQREELRKAGNRRSSA